MGELSDRRRISDRLRRPLVIFVVATLLAGWVFFYRFNTLGGAFGGFDNDHFLYFALAKQVQAGEQPLRDFQDAMHGAWPSLTYELSAAAQRVLGNGLRSEAFLSVGGVVFAAVIAFIAATVIAPWPWAAITAFVTAMLSPKLYGYPKVLVTAVAVLLIVGTSGRPTWSRIAVMSLWTAIAFLFRHDYAMYCVLGFLAVIALSAGPLWRTRVERSLAYVGFTAVVLAPSLWWIQRYSGLTEYVRNGLEMSRAEYSRTRIGWPAMTLDDLSSPLALFDRDTNAEAWIYYLFVVVPVLAIGVAAWRAYQMRDGDGRAAAVVALSLMTVALWYSFLRGNVGVRVGEMGPPIAVLGAWLLSLAVARGRPWPQAVPIGAAALGVLVVTTVCTWRLAEVTGELRTARLLEPQDVFERTSRVSHDLSEMPRSLREHEAADRMQAADYLHRCTRPTDRVISIGYYPEVTAFSERLFAGGRVTFVVVYYANERYMRDTIAKLESQSVPIILGDTTVEHFQPLVEYLRARYDEVGAVTIVEGSLRVWVRRGLSGTPSGPNGLPCFG